MSTYGTCLGPSTLGTLSIFTPTPMPCAEDCRRRMFAVLHDAYGSEEQNLTELRWQQGHQSPGEWRRSGLSQHPKPLSSPGALPCWRQAAQEQCNASSTILLSLCPVLRHPACTPVMQSRKTTGELCLGFDQKLCIACVCSFSSI